MKKKLPVWAGICMTLGVALLVAWLAWSLPLVAWHRMTDVSNDKAEIMLMLFVAATVGLPIGAYISRVGVTLLQWLSGAACAVAWASVVPFALFRHGDDWVCVNQQREAIAYGSGFLLFAVPLVLAKVRWQGQQWTD